MLMVIFGAGASYDSISAGPPLPTESPHEYRMPLARELFDNRQHFNNAAMSFKRCQEILPTLRQAARENNSIEERLQRYLAEADIKLDRRQQLAAVRYYIQAVIFQCQEAWKNIAYGQTNYKSLLDSIRQYKRDGEKVAIVTFNYDNLIEYALQDFTGRPFDSLSSYISDGEFQLFKLHGSVNWARRVATAPPQLRDILTKGTGPAIAAEEIIRSIDEVTPDRKFDIVNQIPTWRTDDGRSIAFPALAIPVRSKPESYEECPDGHVARLKELIPQVTKIIVVGWAAGEEHFKRLLAERLVNKVQMFVVGADDRDAERTGQAMVIAGVRGDFEVSRGGFSHFATHDEPEQFLST